MSYGYGCHAKSYIWYSNKPYAIRTRYNVLRVSYQKLISHADEPYWLESYRCDSDGPYVIRTIVAISYGRVTELSVWDSMMLKKKCVVALRRDLRHDQICYVSSRRWGYTKTKTESVKYAADWIAYSIDPINFTKACPVPVWLWLCYNSWISYQIHRNIAVI